MPSSVPGAGAPCADLREPPSHGNRRINNSAGPRAEGVPAAPLWWERGEGVSRKACWVLPSAHSSEGGEALARCRPSALMPLSKPRGGLVGTLRIAFPRRGPACTHGWSGRGLLFSESSPPAKGNTVSLSSNVTHQAVNQKLSPWLSE